MKSKCFHGSNKATLENGESKQISELENGDSVLAMNKDGSLIFSPVIMQLMQSPEEDATFRIIRTSLGNDLSCSILSPYSIKRIVCPTTTQKLHRQINASCKLFFKSCNVPN